MIAWHFARDDRQLGYGDGRQIVVGETLYVPGPPVLCRHGLHASRRAIDALKYAAGAYICRVELTGEVVEDTDKAVATGRCCVAAIDGTALLRRFAKQQALSVIHLWNAPQVVHDYLNSDTEELRDAARDAARAAAWDAARDAAWAVARDAARAVAWDVAWAVAWDAARAAARDAARAAARDAAWDAARAVAWAAAWDAARAAARDAANKDLETLLAKTGL